MDFCSVHRAWDVSLWDISAVIGKGVWERPTGNRLAFASSGAVFGSRGQILLQSIKIIYFLFSWSMSRNFSCFFTTPAPLMVLIWLLNTSIIFYYIWSLYLFFHIFVLKFCLWYCLYTLFCILLLFKQSLIHVLKWIYYLYSSSANMHTLSIFCKYPVSNLPTLYILYTTHNNSLCSSYK